jgi:hypothetical protein
MENHSRFIGFGIAIGLAIGIAMSVVTHQPAVWLLLGIGTGLAVGVAIRDRRKAQCAPVTNRNYELKAE